MKILLSKSSDVPVRQQLAEQIIFLISTGEIRPGEQLPSVRALARQLKLHHNTVSEAYQELVERGWVSGRKGSRLTVGAKEGSGGRAENGSLDGLINDCIQRAKENGFSLQALMARVRERLRAQPPDHILVVEDEPGLRAIIAKEVGERLEWAVEGCSLAELKANKELVVGGQVCAPTYVLGKMRGLVPRDRPAVAIEFADAKDSLAKIRKLEKPSVIGVVSVSQTLLNTARALLAPAIGRKHTIRQVLVDGRSRADCGGLDLVFCDSLAMPIVKCPNKCLYRLVAEDCFSQLAGMLEHSEVRLVEATRGGGESG